MAESIVLKPELLRSVFEDAQSQDTFAACLNARGLYNSMQFVLRLSPVVHKLVDGLVDGSNVSWEGMQAYSTYLHETVHWWQHVGSTLGFVISVSYPAQAHINFEHMKFIASSGKASKSVKSWAEKEMLSGLDHQDQTVFHANVAVNNVVDIEYFKKFILRPDLVATFANDVYFECVGHSFHITYGNVLGVLSTTCDQGINYLPDPRSWSAAFRELGEQRVRGYFHGSPIAKPPVGLVAILEGQARFIQLQFLSFSCRDHLEISDLKDDGYLEGIYGEAFYCFLRITSSTAPLTVHDPLVGLFLLVCDLSINPTRGFPLQIIDYKKFIDDIDPGVRFLDLCLAVANNPKLKNEIREYTRAEYDYVSAELCRQCEFDHPFVALTAVSEWASNEDELIRLMNEKATFKYELRNLPVRVLFSHFVTFCQDKLIRPDFFCWAGTYMVGSRSTTDTQNIWLRHLSLFSDKADDDGIFPREIPGKDPVAVQATFDAFYANNVAYDLTRQWILHEGPFNYDYSWLSRRHSSQKMENWAKELFSAVHGISPDEIRTSV